MSPRNLARTVLALSLLTLPSRAGVIVVSASGGGSFTDLPPAIAAAVDGDVLLIKSGTYTAAAITNKSLDVVADTGATAVIQGELVVSGLAATGTVTLTGLELRATTHVAPALRLSSNAGSIRVQGCTIEGFDQPGCPGGNDLDGGPGLSLVNCNDVCVARCTVHGGDSSDMPEFSQTGDAGRALVALGSRLALYESSVRGGEGGEPSPACGGGFYGYGGSGGDAVSATSCAVLFASGCVLAGGDAGYAWTKANPCPGVGVRLAATPFTRLECNVTAGASPPSDVGVCACYAPVCGAVPQTVAATARQLTATRVVREGTLARIDVTGLPGDRVELVDSSRGKFEFPASHTGVLLLRHSPPLPVAELGTLGPSGQLSVSWPVGDLGPGVLGQRFFVQAVFIEPSGRALHGPPATVVLLDSSL